MLQNIPFYVRSCPIFSVLEFVDKKSSHQITIFGSDRSPRSGNLCLSVRPSESCFKLSIFIILSPNHHDDFRMTSESIKQAFRENSEHSEGTQRILKENSESNQRERGQTSSYRRSLKYFVLFY